MKEILTPFSDETITPLCAGEQILITGKIFAARDAAHKRLLELITAGEKLPFDFNGQAVFYAGPTPAKPGRIIGSIGPTTSGRMDRYSPLLISRGLKIMIGKGPRSREVTETIVKHRGLYLAAIGGAAALMARCVKAAKTIAFEDLGTEAVWELFVERLPLIVAIDSRGKSIYGD
jgi:fumarate hydratase subunit beta